MTRKRKHQKSGRRPRPTAHDRSPATLQNQAETALANGRYKEAVSAYKALLKEEPRPECIAALADAYQGRAQSLAAKGMFKEAAVIWEQRALVCNTPLAEACYIVWLTQTGQTRQAIRLYCDQRQHLQQGGDFKRLQEYVAALAVAGTAEVVDSLPVDDPLRRDLDVAIAALRAYGSGEDGELDGLLRSIPFRSPFREFRQILMALRQREQDGAEAARLLDRIDADSAFAGLARAACIGSLSGSKLIRTLTELDDDSLHLAAALNGWSKQRLNLLRELTRLGATPSPKALFSFLVRHRTVLGETFAREACMRMLVDFPDGVAPFHNAFGKSSGYDTFRISALAEEAHGEPYGADEAWRGALDDLYTRLDEGDNRLRAALILRHLTDICPEHRGVDIGHDPTAIGDLEESLRLDPEDRPTHLRLIAAHRSAGRLKKARDALLEALDCFPNDTEVLLAAVETAIAGNAFKKAVSYARQLLDIDPINPRVQDILLNAHLAHARKQIKGRKYALAHKELEAAAHSARSDAAKGKVLLVRGLMALAAEGPEAARDPLRGGVERLGGGLAGQFGLLIEAARMGRHPRTVLTQAQLPKPMEFASREHVLALIHVLKGLDHEDGMKLLDASLEPLQAALGRAAKHAFTQSESELICETLHQREQFKLLNRYAGQALRRQPGQPIFVYHELYGKAEGLLFVLQRRDLDRLELALDQAHELGDMRTAHRIGEFLRPPFFQPPPVQFPPIPRDVERGIGHAIDEMGLNQVLELLGKIGGSFDYETVKEALGEQDLGKQMASMGGGFDPGEIFNDMTEPRAKPKKKRARKKRINNPNQGDLFE